MRKRFLIFCFLAGFLVSFLPLTQAQKTRFAQTQAKPDPANFPVHVHISSSHIRYSCSGVNTSIICDPNLYADAVIDGKKVELWGQAAIGKIHFAVLAPGDYLAQVKDEAHNADNTAISRNYLLLLSDGTIWNCALSGISE